MHSTQSYANHNECRTHAQQQPQSYQMTEESNSKSINTSDTVEYALSEGTAIEIRESIINNYNRFNCGKNNSSDTSFEKSADLDAKNMTTNKSRDRLGFWGNDSEVASVTSGLDRLRLPRFNKVRDFFFYTRCTYFKNI